jgi:Bacterial pre-peptidase C-terminal domain
VQEYVNLTAYATVSGQIYPNTNTDPLVTVNFPFANVTNSTTKTTDANGSYTYSGGTATITLNGKYIRMSDACGAISLSNSTTGDLNFGGSGGTDCTTPGIGGAGNTHSSRSGYYHLTRINRKAATYHPSNTWVNGVLTSNMNINQTCNANWNGSAINFYRSGGGCSNTGELAAVFLHEWGHGFDTNTGGSASENASGEAVGDTFAFLETKDACIGNNFQPGVPCANCRSTCTGVRDLIPFALGGTRTLATPANIADNNGINCDRFACPYSTPQGFPYRGPMGYQGHCESHIASTSNWDLAQSLVTTHGSTAGWAAMDKIWYASLTPSKSAFQVASGGTCNPAATINGCGASNWYTVYLPADDDNGNLADGTPNACRIWDAFNAHGIACGSRPTCSGGGGGGNTAPTVTISSPAAGASFVQGTSVSFAGSATDTQDGTISANLSWSSSINGAIGTGASFSTSTLSVGSHTITASVTDSGGLSGSATRSITITSTSNALTNGVPVTGISGATGSQQFWTLAVPSGASNLSFTTSGGTGDADLYVKFGSAPTTTVRDCASESGTNAETCSFATPSVGTYHVLVYGYAAYSGLTLTGSYSTGPTTVTVTFTSVGAEDGRIWESGETTNVGGGLNSTDNTTGSIRVGDFSDDTQYRSIVSFDTSSIPDGATIISATLRLKRATVSGTSPFTTHGTCTVDIAGATGWGGAVAIAAGDWQAAASSSGVASMSNPASDGTFSTGTLNAAGRTAVNKTGKTQLRVYMTTDDNDDLGSDYMGFYSGEAATGNKPELVIQYQ